MVVGSEGHEVIQNNVVDGVGDFSVVTLNVRGFPGGAEDGIDYFLQTWVFFVAGVELGETSGAFGIKQELQRVLGGGFRGCERIKCRAGMNLEVLSIAWIFRRTRRNDF